jgi:neural Wiskott-Aldrich syndrome protein
MALPGRKSLRQFQCNDTLWVTFRRMAEDQEKEVDDMIADAMEAYAQLSGYQTGINALESESQLTPPPSSAHHRQRPAVAAAVAAPPPPLPPLPPPALPPPARSRFAQRMPQPGGVSMFDAPATPPPHPHGAPQFMGAGLAVGFEGTPASQPQIPVYLVFDNQKYRIDKDQFIIGRGTKSSDLPIKDGNISRKHAAVIRRNGTYFIKDLGSTNGIDFKGMRIDNKRIEEGDVFHLCDYELRFTFKR